MDKEMAENIRTEYSALTSYFETVITFRFTTVGFFLAAVGLFAQAGITRSTSALLLLLTIGTWIVELRNRAIFRALIDRAIQIEKDWDFQGHGEYDTLFRRLIRIGLQKETAKLKKEKEDTPFIPDKIKILFWELTLPEQFITHTAGLDLIYLGVLLFSTYKVCHLFM